MKQLVVVWLGGWNFSILHTGELDVLRIEMDLAKTNTTPIGVSGNQLQDLVQDVAILSCRELGVYLEINHDYI